MAHRIAVIGLGYVGLPVALGFARKFPATIGFDINAHRVAELRAGRDHTGEASAEELAGCSIKLTSDAADLAAADVFIVCVPTPIFSDRRPDLRPLQSASQTVGRAMRAGATVVYESTVYPGVTEDFCSPILEQASGLKRGRDFKVGYSPERINPGDREHTFEKIVKVVSGEDAATAQLLATLYGAVVKAGIHVAPTIKAAETAKVLENTQRDLNIALMNELAIICDLIGIRTQDVLDAAGTKWNFLKFSPGLVGGHCIGVDPYYLTSKAQELGYHPDVTLAGRRVNDSMSAHIARRTVKFLSELKRPLGEARVGILGVTFKENVPDIRNSRVPDIVAELAHFGIHPLVSDAFAAPQEVQEEYGLALTDAAQLHDLDALILAVPHASYLADKPGLFRRLRGGGIFMDVKSAVAPSDVTAGLRYWSL